jgi:phosphoribosylamine--glycine ligase
MKIELRPGCAICVVISASGYPGRYATGDLVWIPPALADGVAILHSGTRRDASGRLVTAGGRVLGVTAVGATLSEASARAYEACASIRCVSKYYRRDIGARQLKRA